MGEQGNKNQSPVILNQVIEDDLGGVTKTIDKSELPRIESGEEDLLVVPQRGYLVEIVGANAGKMYEIPRELVIGRDRKADLLINDDSVSRRHASLRITPEGSFEIEDLGSSNGTLVNDVEVERQLLTTGDKLTIGLNTVFLFSQQSRLDEQILESQKMESLGRLAGGIAHDFNNVIAAVVFNMDYMRGLVRDGPIDPASMDACLDDTKAAVKRAADLTNQLLGFARRGPSSKEPTDISSLVEEVVRLVQRTFDRAIRIDHYIDSNLTVIGDRGQLHQLLMNLCLNARDAMPRGGTLRIEAKLKYIYDTTAGGPEQESSLGAFPHVVITISDTGLGMDEEVRRRIFDPFFTTKDHGKGTGLGLATVYWIVKHHRGHIYVNSKPNAGTTFQAFLPASSISIVPRPDTIPSPREEAGGVIMVVDDDQIMQRSTARVLERMGYEPLCCSDGLEAVKTYRHYRRNVDLILLDMIMPNQGGADTFIALRALDPEAKILLMSGYAEDSEIQSLLKQGAEGFLRKPCSVDQLKRAIAESLDTTSD